MLLGERGALSVETVSMARTRTRPTVDAMLPCAPAQMQEDARARASASHSLAEVRWASVQGQNHVPVLGKGLQHLRKEADKIDERVRIGPTALAP